MHHDIYVVDTQNHTNFDAFRFCGVCTCGFNTLHRTSDEAAFLAKGHFRKQVGCEYPLEVRLYDDFFPKGKQIFPVEVAISQAAEVASTAVGAVVPDGSKSANRNTNVATKKSS